MSQDDEIEYPRRGYTTEDVATQRSAPRSRRRRWVLTALGLVVGLPLLLMAVWTWITLTYTYSRGERVGYAQKLSKRGWVCKTWEGELAIANVPGQLQERFEFTVPDDRVAADISRLEGERVALSYEQHRFIPFSCFGDTEYFVTDVRAVGQSAFPAPAAQPAPTAQPPTPQQTPAPAGRTP